MFRDSGYRPSPTELNPFELDLPSLSTKDLIKSVGGWKEGHYVFRTGEHGNGYIDKMGFLRYPNVMREIGARLAKQFGDQQEDIDLVVGPSIIGAIIACSTADQLNVPYSLTYRTKPDQNIHFHRGYVPEEGSRILFVDDFVFSGKDLKDNVAFINDYGMYIIGASVIGKRQEIPLDIPMRSLIDVDFSKSSPEECTMCESNIPIKGTNIRE